jgi:hypothetical protein
VLELRRQAGLAEIDPLAAHRDPVAYEQMSVRFPFWQAAVRPDDTMPRDVVRVREDEPDEPRRARFDVTVGAHEPLPNRAYPLGDAGSATGDPFQRVGPSPLDC